MSPVLCLREPQVRDVRRHHRLDQLEAAQVAHAVEQALAAAEQHRHQVQLHFIDEPGLQDQYRLEVSSPGLERKLRRPKHYRKSVGRDVVAFLCPGRFVPQLP